MNEKEIVVQGEQKLPEGIISLAERRSKWATGEAKCIVCNHEWIAVAQEGDYPLNCPKCELQKGVFTKPFFKKNTPHWTCNCGNLYFCVTKEGYYCGACGADQHGF